MPLNRSTLIRLTTIDRCLQNHYRKWTLQDLIDACSDALYEMEGRMDGVSRRTVQSDIQLMRSDKLGYNAPIVVKERKYYTYEDPDYSITNIPLNNEDIETLNSAMEVLRHFQIFSQFSAAETVINKLEEHIAVSVNKRQPIIDLEKNNELKGLHFVSQLYRAIEKRMALTIVYHSFKSNQERVMDVSPYLLKEYRNRWFLLCLYKKHPKDLQILALDRMVKIVPRPEGHFRENTLFDPGHFFDDVIGVTKGVGQPAKWIRLLFDADQAPYVLTKPLHPSQKLVREYADGSIEISIQVVLNCELEREILGFADHVKVLAPSLLRHNIRKKLQLAALMYSD